MKFFMFFSFTECYIDNCFFLAYFLIVFLSFINLKWKFKLLKIVFYFYTYNFVSLLQKILKNIHLKLLHTHYINTWDLHIFTK